MMQSGFKTTGILVGVLLTFVLSARSAAPSNDVYTVQGTAFYDTFGHGAHLESRFTITVSNHWWALETVAVTPIVRGSRILLSDGDTLVALHSFPTNPIRSGNASIVVLDRADVPYARDPLIPVIWVTYAAQFYLPPGTNGLLRPFWHEKAAVRTNAFVSASWNLISPGNPLPESMKFFYDAKEWDKIFAGNWSQNSPPRNSEHLEPWGTYQALGITNVGGRVFPLASVFEVGLKSPVFKEGITNALVRSAIDRRLFGTICPGISVVRDLRKQNAFARESQITNMLLSTFLTERGKIAGP